MKDNIIDIKEKDDQGKKFSVRLAGLKNVKEPEKKHKSTGIKDEQEDPVSSASTEPAPARGNSNTDMDDLKELDDIQRTLDILAVKKTDKDHRKTISQSPAWRKYSELKATVVDKIIKNDFIRNINQENLAKYQQVINQNITTAIKEEAKIRKMIILGEEMNFISLNIYNDIFGYGPLEKLLKDDTVSEIMVVGADKTFVERKGKIERVNVDFVNDEHLMNVIDRIVSGVGRRIDISTPYVDARLMDGSRVHVIIPPLAADGPILTIRKFSTTNLQMEDLIHFDSASPQMAFFLGACVKAKINIVISGGTGSGKTTLLNILSTLIPPDERIVTIEDSLELQVHNTHDHVARLETRHKNVEGKGEISIRDLVINSLRMRPDRIIVGECRGGEALDMLQAMNTGHEGSMTSIHSNSPNDALGRLTTMVLMSGFELPVSVVKKYIGSAVDLIIQQSRFPDGSRKISHVTEVEMSSTGDIHLHDIFLYKQTGFDDKGGIIGKHIATGRVPVFVEKFSNYNITIPIDSLKPEKDTGNKSSKKTSSSNILDIRLHPFEDEMKTSITKIENFLQQKKVRDKIIDDISLSLAEFITNVIKYAEVDENEWIEIQVRCIKKRIIIEIVDPGKQEPPKNKPGLPEPLQVGGRGRWLVQKIMDKTSHKRKGTLNIATLIKNRE